MKIITLTLLLCFTITICQSQSFKIGKVDKEEFTTSEEILEGAIYLEKYRETFFEYEGNKGWILITEIKERIKITSKEGLDYATNKVYLYKNSPDYEDLRKFKAFTHNLSGKKVIKESLSKDAYFETEKNKKYQGKYCEVLVENKLNIFQDYKIWFGMKNFLTAVRNLLQNTSVWVNILG